MEDNCVLNGECRPLLSPAALSEPGRRGQRQWSLTQLWRYQLTPWVPARHVLAVLIFLGFVNVYALRINLSMAIVTMANSSAKHSTHLQFNWNSKQQGWVLSSFFYGYIITQIPGGYLAGRFGGRYVFGIGILMTSILTLLTPIAAQLHMGALIALRILEGMFEGVTAPAVHALWGKWAPPKERSVLASFTYAGPFAGNIISFPITAVLCEYGFAGGWPSVFYVFGGIGVIWFIFWLCLGYSSPSTHPRISEEERKYIELSIEEDSVKQTTTKVPWFRIMTSSAVWAIIVAHVCNNWGANTLLTCIPSFFEDAMHLSHGKGLIQNGVYSAVPYAAFTLLAIIAGIVADLLRKKYLSTVVVRKIFNTSGMVFAAVGLVIVGYLWSNRTLCVLFLTLAVGCSGLAQAGFNINHIDIAPQYAGILMGITNTAGTIPGIVGPLVAKMIAKKPNDGLDQSSAYAVEWREVYIIAAEVYVFGAIVYAILGEGRRQHWAGGEKDVGVAREGEKDLGVAGEREAGPTEEPTTKSF